MPAGICAVKRIGVNAKDWNRYSYWALWFNAFWAAMGSWYLLGRAEPMPTEYLDDSPFSNYDGPGLILLLVVGGSSLLAAVARWRGWDSKSLLTIMAGAILLGWLLFEFLWVPEGWMAQVLFAIVAAVIMIGGYQGWRRSAS